MQDAFAADGAWLRCCFHAHTTNSDGELAPPALAEYYVEAGFDVLAFTDHHVRTVEPSREGLLTIPGSELDATLGEGAPLAHVLALGIAGDPWPRSEPRSLAETVRWIGGEGGVAYLAHPHWSGLRSGDWEGCEGLLGLEVYNAGCDLEVGRGEATSQWDEVLQAGARCFGLAADDTHHPGFDSGLSWVFVHAPAPSVEAVVAALGSGAFYSSTGPTIHSLEQDGNEIVVRCTPAQAVGLVCGPGEGTRLHAGRRGYRHRGEVLATDDDGQITAARLTRHSAAPYARLEVVDARGRKAWTNSLH